MRKDKVVEQLADGHDNVTMSPYVDIIAISFTRKASDISIVKDILGRRGENIKIFAKIESHEGLRNFDAILKASDGIMVCRGGLGMEFPADKLPMAQKYMVKEANLVGKPIYVATQLLNSMMSCERPTRAEASDIANAVIDGVDALQLDKEVIFGANPFKSIEMVSRCALEAE